MTSTEAKKKMDALRREEEAIAHRMAVVMTDCTHRDERGELTLETADVCTRGTCLGCGKYVLDPWRQPYR